MKRSIESSLLKFQEVKDYYTPIVKGKINEFIEIEYKTKCIYSVTWVNRFEEFKTNNVLGSDLHDFVLMIHNKYFNFLTFKLYQYENQNFKKN